MGWGEIINLKKLLVYFVFLCNVSVTFTKRQLRFCNHKCLELLVADTGQFKITSWKYNKGMYDELFICKTNTELQIVSMEYLEIFS